MFIKKGFRFLSRFLRVWLQVWKKYKYDLKIFFAENKKGIKTRRISRWFQICWKRFYKMYKKKLLAKTWRKYALFPLLLMFLKTCFACNFFAFFKNFFNRFKISMKFCVFWHLFDFFPKNLVWVILVLFSNFEAKRATKRRQNKKRMK